MSVIRYDPNDPQPFILISGDVISNMDLKKAIQYHKDKRAVDKVNHLLTASHIPTAFLTNLPRNVL